MSPRQTLTAVASPDTRPRHTHAGQPRPTTGTMGRRGNPRREFALLTVETARSAGLLDADGELLDHELTPSALRSMAIATVADQSGTDDALESQAPGVLVQHGHRDAVAAQLNHGHDMLPFGKDGEDPAPGDLTFWVEAAPSPVITLKPRTFFSFADALQRAKSVAVAA